MVFVLLYNGENMIGDLIEAIEKVYEGKKKGLSTKGLLFLLFILFTVQSFITGIEYDLKSHFQTYKTLSAKWQDFKLGYYNVLKSIGKNLLWAIYQASEKIGNIGIAETTIEIPEGRRKPLTGQQRPSYPQAQCPSPL